MPLTGYIASRTVESILIVVGVLSVMSVVALRQDLGVCDGVIWPHPRQSPHRCFSSRGGGGVESRVELFETIRRDADRCGLSIRALSEKYEVHRRTVRQALAGATPPPRKRTFPAPRLDPVKPLIDAMLREDLTVSMR